MENNLQKNKEIKMNIQNDNDTWMVNSIAVNKDETKAAYGVRILREIEKKICKIL